MALPITLSIVSHGHGRWLHRLLTQLDAQASLKDVHVVLTLNLPEETFDTSPFKSLAFTVLRNPSPRGFGANHNQAFAHCSTPCFAILNPDLVLVDEEPFTALVRRCMGDHSCALTAPVVLGPTGGREDSVRANLTPWSLVARQLLGRRRPLERATRTGSGRPFFWVAGMCMVVEASAFRAIGGFDERYFLYCEDYDLCARLHLSGRFVAVEPNARIAHDARRDSHGSFKHLRWHLQSLLRVWTSAPFWRVTLGAS